MSASPDVAIVGGGLIGSFIAWRAAQRGLRVRVFDDARDTRASWAAAGMLAPVSEYHPTEPHLTNALLQSAAVYAGVVDELEAATGQSCDYRAHGTLVIGVHADDVAAIAELRRQQQAAGVSSETMCRSALLAMEPALSPDVRAGLFAADDHQVDPRRLLMAAIAAGKQLGVDRVATAVSAFDQARGALTLTDGTNVAAGAIVVACGAWTSLLSLPAPLPVRPVKGQILRLRTVNGTPLTGPVVRGLVRGIDVYVISRTDGEIVIGATSEERGFDQTRTAGALHALLRDARTLLPDIDEAIFVEHRVGFRPGSPDNGPLIGRLAIDSPAAVFAAVGHHRNGVLLTPLTGEVMAAQLMGETCAPGSPAASFAPFAPDRSMGDAA